MTECIFCIIAQGKIGTLIYEDKRVVAFNDENPQAPVHILIVPRRHIETVNDISAIDGTLLEHMIIVAIQLSRSKNIATTGYRLVMNCDRDGGQTVFHIHLHLLGGRQMNWPPG